MLLCEHLGWLVARAVLRAAFQLRDFANPAGGSHEISDLRLHPDSRYAHMKNLLQSRRIVFETYANHIETAALPS